MIFPELKRQQTTTERLADNITKSLGLNFPINMEAVLEQLSGDFIETPDAATEITITKSLNHFTIYTKQCNKQQRRFVLAKALFCWLVFMKSDSYSNGLDRTDRNQRHWENYISEYFAFYFLMGKKTFYDVVQRHTLTTGKYAGWFSVAKVAEHYDLPEMAVKKWHSFLYI